MTIIKMELIDPKPGQTLAYKNPFSFPVYIGNEKLKDEQEGNLDRIAWRIARDETVEICAKEIYIFYHDIFPKGT